LACFFVLTPLALLSGWLCIVGAQSYSNEQQQKQFLPVHRRLRTHETIPARASRDISNSTWTSVGLLSLTGTLVAAYVIWIFVAFRYHIQVWREWQLRNYIVTIVPLANGEYCYPPTPTPTPAPTQPEARDHGGQGQENRPGRGGRHARGSDQNMNYPEDSDNGSPTTRFIQELFIPSMGPWETSHPTQAANTAQVVANDDSVSVEVDVDADGNPMTTTDADTGGESSGGGQNEKPSSSSPAIDRDRDGEEVVSVLIVPSSDGMGRGVMNNL